MEQEAVIPVKVYSLHAFRKAKQAIISKYGPLLLEGGGTHAAELQQDCKALANYSGLTVTRIITALANQVRETTK